MVTARFWLSETGEECEADPRADIGAGGKTEEDSGDRVCRREDYGRKWCGAVRGTGGQAVILNLRLSP
jgi:hypothetical protein